MHASEMTLIDGPRMEVLRADPGASRAAEHFAGHAIVVKLQDPAGKFSVTGGQFCATVPTMFGRRLRSRR